MLDLSACRNVVVLGGGTAGWLAALELRQLFGQNTTVSLIESPTIGILGAGEGSLPNFESALARYRLPREEFMRETRATYKLGVTFEGWRTGAADDVFWHPFLYSANGTWLDEWKEPNDSYPLASAILNQGWSLGRYPDAHGLVQRNASQSDVQAYLDAHPGERIGYHFDARRMAAYFQRVAVERGVEHIQATVQDVEIDERGHVRALLSDEVRVEADFVIDASGLRRQIVGKRFGSAWKSFADHLLLDSATPFFVPSGSENPPLVTRAIAMQHGWMWCIPTLDRLGVGYVYSSRHVDREGALAEASRYWGREIEPIDQFAFEPGHFEQVWMRNVMTVGLASGFVEPLEATSIGQTIDQLAYFARLVAGGQGYVPQTSIDLFNRETAAYWDGIRDFLFMHYDTPRQDTAFWQRARSAPKPSSYAELREVMQHRPPRPGDLNVYRSNGSGMFAPLNWMAVAAPLGVLPRHATGIDMLALSQEKRQRAGRFLSEHANRMA